MLRAHGMKSDEKPLHVVIDRYFSLFLKGFEDFS